jgi:hypothetical protein
MQRAVGARGSRQSSRGVVSVDETTSIRRLGIYARELGVTSKTVWAAATGKTWTRRPCYLLGRLLLAVISVTAVLRTTFLIGTGCVSGCFLWESIA